MSAQRALEVIATKHAEALATIQRNGFVFNHIGAEPGNWQHLAFSLYSDLCEVDAIARAALAEMEQDA